MSRLVRFRAYATDQPWNGQVDARMDPTKIESIVQFVNDQGVVDLEIWEVGTTNDYWLVDRETADRLEAAMDADPKTLTDVALEAEYQAVEARLVRLRAEIERRFR